MARSGLCSRRDAESWIEQGRVKVGGKVITSPALNVTDLETILVDGKPLPDTDKTRLWLYYKPKGLVVTHKDPEGRPTVFDELKEKLPRVVSVGRLDLTSEGLLLLTNDGEVARRLESPKTGLKRQYRVRVYGHVDPKKLDWLQKGITIEGVRYAPCEAILDTQKQDNAWITMILSEGKNREIRKIMEHFGWVVNRLLRVSFGPFELQDMKPGDLTEVPAKMVKSFLNGLSKESSHANPVRNPQRKSPPKTSKPNNPSHRKPGPRKPL